MTDTMQKTIIEEYWLKKLSGELPKISLPLVQPMKTKEAGVNYFISNRIDIPELISSNLLKTAKNSQIALFILALSGLTIALQRYTGVEDLVVGTISPAEKETPSILFFRSHIHSKITVKEFILQTRDEVQKSINYCPDSTVDFITSLSTKNEKNLPDIFNVAFIYEPFQRKHSDLDRFDFLFILFHENGHLKLEVQYQLDASSHQLMIQFCRSLLIVFENITIFANQEIFRLDLITPEEKNQLMYQFNDTKCDFPEMKPIHRLFEEQVERTPENIGLVSSEDGSTLTYQELNQQSNQLARQLRTKGVGRDHIIGVMIERSIEMIVGIFGILKVEGAYLPISPQYPLQRVEYILRDSGTKILLSSEQFCPPATIFNGEIVDLSDNTLFQGEQSNLLETCSLHDSLAYMIYTSGSTGHPKGSMIEHRSVVNRINWMQKNYPISQQDCILQKTPSIFDVSVWELFWWSMQGATLCLLGAGEEKNPESIANAIKNSRVTTIHFVPSMLNNFISYIEDYPEQLKQIVGLIQVFASGEALHPSTVKKFYKLFPENSSPKLINLYGPTEATVDVSYFNCSPKQGDQETIPIGKPIDNIALYIINENYRLQPIGVIGELCIAGVGLARGYLNKPELTAEKFVDLSRVPDQPLPHSFIYKTGDLARWLPDGDIQFLGRIDHQVKIRGYRIELGEIENRLLTHPDIKDAVVIAVEEKNEVSQKYLCSYIVLHKPLTALELNTYLSKELPDYMIPTYFVPINKIPLTPNGKLDRKALPEPGVTADVPYSPPRDYVEETLVGIWSSVLGVEKNSIGVDHNFFLMGGHSLKATIVTSQIHRELEVKIPLSDFFKLSTIRGLSSLIKQAQRDHYIPLTTVEKKEFYPLSPAQKRLYLLQNFELKSTVYNISWTFPLSEDIDSIRLKQTLAQLVARHESLRTSFHMMHNHPVQKIHDQVTIELERCTYLDFIRPFVLSEAPLLRVGIEENTGHCNRLLIDMHHIISDGVSQTLLNTEFLALYSGTELPSLKLQYKDYAQWLNTPEQKEAIKRQETYWVDQFARHDQVPVLQLPTDYPRPIMQSFEGATVKFVLEEKDTRLLKTISTEKKTTVFMTLLSLCSILLAKLSSQEDIIIGTPIANRRHIDLENIIGMFVNTLPIRSFPVGEKTFIEFLQEVKDISLGVYENQEYPFEELVEKISPLRDITRNPIFVTVFTLLEQTEHTDNIPNNQNKTSFSPQHTPGIAKFDLTFTAVDMDEEFLFYIEYCTKLFKPETIERFITYFKNTVSAITADINIRISEIDFLPKYEREQLLYGFNDINAQYPKGKVIHQLFEEQVAATPDYVAVTGFGDVGSIHPKNEHEISITYSQLNERSNLLALRLMEKGIQHDCVIAIMMERQVEMVVGIIGILKTGAAYLPIVPDYPAERIQYMLADSGAKLLVTTSTLAREAVALKQWKGEKLIIDDYRNGWDQNSSALFNQFESSPTNPAYIIYTSGTTGKPKGSLIEHLQVVRLMFNNLFQFDFDDCDRWTLFHSFCFDFSVWEMYGPLLRGGVMVLVPGMTAQDPQRFLQLLETRQITILNQTPAAFYNLTKEVLKTFRPLLNLKYVIFGGDTLKPSKLKEFQDNYSQTRLINMYGITETTVFVTFKEIDEKEFHSDISNIGKPMPTLTVDIVDRHMNLQPIGVPGELIVGGLGVARGYLNRPELTAEKFPVNQRLTRHSASSTNRFYKSGDLVKWTPEGEIEYLGRIDHQIKIRGFRIELGEIEFRLLAHKDIREIFVLAREEEGGERYLCAYYVAVREIDIMELRNILSKHLPDYMIPSYFLKINAFPLTANGKIDRRALPLPEIRTVSDYVEPRNDTERKLAEIWQEVLGRGLSQKKGEGSPIKPGIGIRDNFFDLGGDSLKSIVLVHQIRDALDIEMTLLDFFSNPTIEKLSEHLKSRLNSAPPSQQSESNIKTKYTNSAGDSDDIYKPFPLTHLQEAYLMGRSEQFDMGGISTHLFIEMNSRMDIHRLNKSINKLILRHPALRTLVGEDGKQQILKIIPEYHIQVEDLTKLDPIIQKERIARVRNRMASYIFDLSQWPLFEIRGLRLSEKELYLMVGLDMVMLDGYSINILSTELGAFYQDPHYAPPPLDFNFRDYVLSMQEFKNSPSYQTDRQYWQKKLEEFPLAPQLPLSCKPSEIKNPTFGKCAKSFPQEEWDAIKDIARKNNVTPSTLLCTAYAKVLFYWCNQKKFALNLTLFNRYPYHKDVNQIVGNFTSVILLDIDWKAEFDLSQMARELQETLLEGLEHRSYDGIQFMRDISRHKKLHTEAVMPVVFSSITQVDNPVNQYIPGEAAMPDILEEPEEPEDIVEFKRTETQTSQIFLEVHAILGEHQLLLTWDFVKELFEPSIVDSMFDHFISIVDSLKTGNIDYQLALPERDRLIWDRYNDTAEEFPASLLHEMFKQQAMSTPRNIALEYETEKLTYHQLDEKSNQVAAYLKANGVGRNTTVAVVTTRSIATMINIMGILKAGGAYVPIDPEYPEDRKNYIFENSNCQIMIESDLYESQNLNRYPVDDIKSINVPEDLAYVIYTSGSTGRPKGVMITHQQAANTIIDINQKFNVTEADRILGISSMCFDLSVYDIFGSLSTGACLVLIPTQKDVEILIKALDEKKITLWNSVPAIMGLIVSSLEKGYQNPYLTHALLSGDWIPLTLPETTKKFFPNCTVTSLGGATEGSIWSIYYPIADVKKEWNSIPYGYPLANQIFYVLNDQQQVCPVGVPGELYIGGTGVAEGYMNDEDKTNRAFLQHPKYGKIYKTGDHGVFQKEGYIEFMGRKDHQVKIRGYRVELGEIESCLLEHPRVKNVVVIDHTNELGSKYLCAYWVAVQGCEVPETDLKNFLSQKLPRYMIPTFFMALTDIPLTENGKIDYKLLQKLELNELNTALPTEYVQPRNNSEQKLAEVWGLVLGKENIGIHDNFFMIGGDSIKAIQVASHLKRDGVTLELKNFFQYPTILELSPHLKQLKTTSNQSPITGSIPLSPVQKYFYEKVLIDPHHFNQAVLLFSKEKYQIKALEIAFKKLHHHHDALRITFSKNGEHILQTNNGPNYPPALEEFDYKNRQFGESNQALNAAVMEKVNLIQASIRLDSCPLMKLGLFHLDDGDYLLIAIHHLVIDGISWRILLEDFNIAYNLAIEEKEIELPLKSTSYKEWSEHLQNYANQTELLKELDYWKTLVQSSVPSLPKYTDLEPTERKVKNNRLLSFELSEEDTWKLLMRVNQAYNTEINDILLSALGLGIQHWAGMEKAMIQLEGHGREEIIEGINITRTIGWFTSIFPVLLEMGNTPDISRLIKRTKDMLRRIPNRGIGFGILKYLTDQAYTLGSPWECEPEIVFNYLGQFDASNNSNPDQTATINISTGNSISPQSNQLYSLDISGMITGGILRMSVTYNAEEFANEHMVDFVQKFKKSLEQLIAHCTEKEKPEKTLSDYTSSDFVEEEVEQIVEYVSGTFKNPEIKDIYSLSAMQEGMLFHYLVNEQSTAYIEQMNLRINGSIDHELFGEAFNKIIQRHDVLRTLFLYKNMKKPRQVVLKQRTSSIRFENIFHLKKSEQEKYIKDFIIKDRETGFDLTSDVPMRFSILKLSETEYAITRSFHHIIMDGWCSEILQKEMLEIYYSLLSKAPLQLPAPVPYQHFIKWLESQDKDEGLNYWREYLIGFDTPSWIPHFKEAEEGQYRQLRHLFRLNRELSEKLNSFSSKNGLTLNSIIQSVWGILLQHYNNSNDVLFGFVVSGRPVEIPNIEMMIGLCINTIPMRITNLRDASFLDLVKQVQHDRARSIKYEYVSLAEIQNSTSLKRNLLNHTMIFENYPIGTELKSLDGETDLGFAVNGGGLDIYEQTNYDLDVVVIPGELIDFRLQYNDFLYDAVMMVQIEESIRQILRQTVDNEAIRLNDIEIMSEAQKNRVLYQFNLENKISEYPQNSQIHHLFEVQASETPYKTAVVFGGREINYKEIDLKAERLASKLKTQGVVANTIVPLIAARSIEVVIGIMAVLKAGGAFLPIDPELPEARINYILNDCNAHLLLTHQSLFDVTKKNLENIIIKNRIFIDEYFNDSSKIDDIKETDSDPVSSALSETRNNQPGTSSDLAYIIYTSGTTGKPKGVMIEHRGIVNYTCWALDNYVKNEAFSFPLYTSISFDLTLTSIFTPLISGNRVVVYGEDDKELVIERIIKENIVEIIKLTPSHLKLIRERKMDVRNSRVRCLIVGGENLETKLASDIYAAFNKNIEIYNEYGPTETVVGCMIYKYNPDTIIGKSVPIGIPIANTQIYLLDKELNPVPPGVAGELCVGGHGVARGYLGKEELTAEKFPPNPFIKDNRIYKTGDLARFLPDGNIEFLGRTDNQVKIRGFRIELAEIEFRLTCHEKIKSAILLAREPISATIPPTKNEDKCLYAYIVSDEELTVPELREYLGHELPSYMVPSYFIRIAKIPLTANGKIDFNALPLSEGIIDTGIEYAAPGNDIEELISTVWKKILLREKISIDDNFFDSGGTSIDIIRLAGELSEAFKMDIPVTETFRYATIRTFAEYIRNRDKELDGVDHEEIDRSEYQDRGRQRRKNDKSKRRMIRNANG